MHLKSGGYIVVDETEALVAIDVNTGRHKGGRDQERSILAVNLEAADEITRQRPPAPAWAAGLVGGEIGTRPPAVLLNA